MRCFAGIFSAPAQCMMYWKLSKVSIQYLNSFAANTQHCHNFVFLFRINQQNQREFSNLFVVETMWIRALYFAGVSLFKVHFLFKCFLRCVSNLWLAAIFPHILRHLGSIHVYCQHYFLNCWFKLLRSATTLICWHLTGTE